MRSSSWMTQSGPHSPLRWAAMARRKSDPHQEPVAAERQPDRVPARSLRPLGPLDRRSDGAPLGSCARCGGLKWWDNRSAKRAGQSPADTPDFRCVGCRAAHWDHDPPNPAGMSTTVLPAQPAPNGGSGRRCTAVKANGDRCGGGAMAGSDLCGPHAGASPSNRCQGVTKAGRPCGAGAPKGERFCPAHGSQES